MIVSRGRAYRRHWPVVVFGLVSCRSNCGIAPAERQYRHIVLRRVVSVAPALPPRRRSNDDRIAVPAESAEEPRVGRRPKPSRNASLGAEVAVGPAPAFTPHFSDADYEAAGADRPTAAHAVKDADIVLKVRRPPRRRQR